MEAHDDSAPWFVKRVGSWTYFLWCSFFLFSSLPTDTVAHFSPSLSGPWWLPPGWRPSAARTETRRRSSWSLSSLFCSGLWLWEAQLSASSSLFCKFCQSARATEDWDSILCQGQRPPPGYCSSSVSVTYWDAQVQTVAVAFSFFFFQISWGERGKKMEERSGWFSQQWCSWV